MKNNTGTVRTVDFWREQLDKDDGLVEVLNDLKRGSVGYGSTRNWDINWLMVAIAAGEGEVVEGLLHVHDQQWGLDHLGLTLKQRIAFMMLSDETYESTPG